MSGKALELPRGLRDRADDSVSRLRATLEEYKNVCCANSLGPEAVVLTDLIWSFVPDIEVFSIDTGRLYPETYDLVERLQQRYGRMLRMVYPKAGDLEDWVAQKRRQRLWRRFGPAARVLWHS